MSELEQISDRALMARISILPQINDGFLDKVAREEPDAFVARLQTLFAAQKRQTFSFLGIAWSLSILTIIISLSFSDEASSKLLGLIFLIVASAVTFCELGQQRYIEAKIIELVGQIPRLSAANFVLKSLPKDANRNLTAQNLAKILPRLPTEDARTFLDKNRPQILDLLNKGRGIYAREGYLGDLLPALFDVISAHGDREFLKETSLHTLCEASITKEITTRTAAEDALATLTARLDYGTVENIADHFRFSASSMGEDMSSDLSYFIVHDPFHVYGLIFLLPQVTPELAKALRESGKLTAERWKRLYALLERPVAIHGMLPGSIGYPPELFRVILDLAERLEDTQALHSVERRAHAATDSTMARQIRVRAREVLPILEEKARREQVGKTLLRASDVPAGQLLRPVAEKPTAVDATQMLRASGASLDSERESKERDG